MATKERKVYNNIPKESSLYVKPLPPNEIVRYRLLGVVDPVTGKKKLRTQILSDVETVVDESGEMYDIAVIESETASGEIKFFPIVFADDTDSAIELRGGSVMDQKVYKRLEISNYNQSNPGRDQSVTPLFERINIEADAEQSRAKRRKIQQALGIVDAMTDADVTEFLRALKRPVGKTESNRNALEEIAERSPDTIMKANVSTASDSLKQEIETLKKEGVISYNKETKKWIAFDDSTILSIKKTHGFKPEDELYLHFANKPESLTKVKFAYQEVANQFAAQETKAKK
jgi:hypothetical protein